MARLTLDVDRATEAVLSRGDEWQSWRALRLTGDDGGEMPEIPGQDATGAFVGTTGRASPGATGEAACHLITLGLVESPACVIAIDWLEEARTPALAWLDAPEDVPGALDSHAGGRVWATASSSAALLAAGRDPGARAIDLLRGEADLEGHFTGGAYPTFAAAAVYWLTEGPRTEIAEWALRWARENDDEVGMGPWERATALTFWKVAGIPAEHASVERFVEELSSAARPEGWVDELELTLRSLEAIASFAR